MLKVVRNKFLRKRTSILFAFIFVLLFFCIIQSYKPRRRFVADNSKSKIIHVKSNQHVVIDGSILSNRTMPNISTVHSTSLPIKTLFPLKTKQNMGSVNVHLWQPLCSNTIDSLRQHPLFPSWPSLRGRPAMSKGLISILSSMRSAQRVLGLLYPPLSGNYRFEISSRSMSEFWLSKSTDPRQSSMLARLNKNILHGIHYANGVHIPKSNNVHLKQETVYYFEILHTVNDISYDSVKVKWLMPGASEFTNIQSSHVSTVLTNDTDSNYETRGFVKMSPSILLVTGTRKKLKHYKWLNLTMMRNKFGQTFEKSQPITKENFTNVAFVERSKISAAFSECSYSPSYSRKRVYKRNEGVYCTHFTDVFPDDDTGGKVWIGYHENPDRNGNKVISESVVIDVVQMFMSSIKDRYPGEFSLVNVVNVERNVDPELGERYFLELVLEDQMNKEFRRVSDYFFLPQNSSKLCQPANFKWSPNVTVNVIITTKNQGSWVVDYIEGMARVIRETRDDNVNLILVDYGNNGIDVETELQRNGVKHFKVIKQKGKFHKTLAIDLAVKNIENPNSIVLLTDLHLDIPNSIFESVRKHTIQGRMSFTPVVFRLKECSRPETEQTSITGYWDSYAFGIFSTFKTDWEDFGGVNVKEFTNKWGGEDWEMTDRVLAGGIEIERLRLPYFHHFFHDKSNMWDSAVRR